MNLWQICMHLYNVILHFHTAYAPLTIRFRVDFVENPHVYFFLKKKKCFCTNLMIQIHTKTPPCTLLNDTQTSTTLIPLKPRCIAQVNLETEISRVQPSLTFPLSFRFSPGGRNYGSPVGPLYMKHLFASESHAH